DLRVAGDAVVRATTHERADAVPGRLLLHLRAGRADRGDGGAGPLRLAGARHPLHRRPHALRADRRDDVPDVRRAVLLAAAGERADAVGDAGAGRVLAAVPGLQPGLPADAPDGHGRAAAAGLHVRAGGG